MEKRLMLLFLVVGLCVWPVATHAATLTPVLVLDMDGYIDMNTVTTVETETLYSMDWADYVEDGVTLPMSAFTDQDGDWPIFNRSEGTVYMTGADSFVENYMAANLQPDEGLKVKVGSGYKLDQSYVWEVWTKPDPNSMLATGGDLGTNYIGWIFMFRWLWAGDNGNNNIGDAAFWLMNDVTQDGTSDIRRVRYKLAGMDAYYNQMQDPCRAIDPNYYHHVGMVYTPDTEEPNYAIAQIYFDGILEATRYFRPSTTTTEFDPNIGIGNFLGNNRAYFEGIGDYYYNAGYCGKIDSFSLSTFTGTFEGPHEFNLVDPQYCGDVGTYYSPYDINKDCWVNFKDFAEVASEWMFRGDD